MFRRRFRMKKSLFMRIVDRPSAEIPYFQQRRDATGRFGHSPLQKATAAIRMMAYGCPADAVDTNISDLVRPPHFYAWNILLKESLIYLEMSI